MQTLQSDSAELGNSDSRPYPLTKMAPLATSWRGHYLFRIPSPERQPYHRNLPSRSEYLSKIAYSGLECWSCNRICGNANVLHDRTMGPRSVDSNRVANRALAVHDEPGLNNIPSGLNFRRVGLPKFRLHFGNFSIEDMIRIGVISKSQE